MRLTLVPIIFLLAACATPEQIEAQKQQRLREDSDTCFNYGFRPNSDGFRNCLLQLELSRRQNYYYYPHTQFHYSYRP